MASANPTNQTSLLKRLYGPNVAFPAYKKSKALGRAKKDTSFGGNDKQVNVTLAPGSGGSSSFAEALANQDATKEVHFLLVHRKEYQVGSVQGDLIARSNGDKNAIAAAVKQQFDKAIYAFNRALATRTWAGAGGSLGTISSGSTVSTDTITLTNTADIVRFEANMYVQLADNDGTGSSPTAPRDGGKKARIGEVDRNDGKLKLASGNWDQISGAATGDHIFRSGDHANAMSGIQGWVPITAPTSGDSFFSLDRSAQGDVQRLSGIRYAPGTNSGGSKEELLLNLDAECHVNGAEPTDVYCNPRDVRDLLQELGSKKQYRGEVKTNHAGIGFSSVVLDGNSGTLNVMSETDVPQGNFWMLNMDFWTLRTAGDCPRILNFDGIGKLLRAASDDAYQFRLGAYGNWECSNPGEQAVGAW